MKKLDRAINQIAQIIARERTVPPRLLSAEYKAGMLSGMQHAYQVCKDVQRGAFLPLVPAPVAVDKPVAPPADIALDVARYWIVNWETGHCIAMHTTLGNLKTVVF